MSLEKSVRNNINRFGSKIELIVKVDGDINFSTGKYYQTIKLTPMVGIIGRYKRSEIIDNVINIDDLRCTIQTPFEIKKGDTVRFNASEYEIINTSDLYIGNKTIKTTLQLRFSNIVETAQYAVVDYGIGVVDNGVEVIDTPLTQYAVADYGIQVVDNGIEVIDTPLAQYAVTDYGIVVVDNGIQVLDTPLTQYAVTDYGIVVVDNGVQVLDTPLTQYAVTDYGIPVVDNGIQVLDTPVI